MNTLLIIKSIKMNVNKWYLVLYLTVLIGNIYVDGLSTATNERDGRKLFGGYRITPKFCRASKTLPSSDPRSHGPTICMFNHECTQRQGEVVGACMDGFLFGACCQLHGEVDTPLIDEQDIDHPQSNLAAALSYESYGNQQSYQGAGNKYTEIKLQENAMKHRPSMSHKYGGIKNNYYGSSIDDESSLGSGNLPSNELYSSHHNPDINGFYVENDSVSVSSPSPEYSSSSSSSTQGYYSTTMTPSTSAQDYYLPPSTGTSPQEAFSQELPTLIPTGPYGASDAFNQISQTMFNSQSADFTYSGITHPGVDSIIVEEGTYAEPVSVSTERLSTTSLAPQKVTHAKPVFKPKPTKGTQNKFVLVQTIDHRDKPSKHGSMSENDIESIESIILMLNDTKTGPQYNTDPTNNYGGSSTNAIDYSKYGQSSYYITTKLPSSTPQPPSTSYVYSPEPTRRPINVQSTIASSYGAVTPGHSTTSYVVTGSSSATTRLPSTSYVTGSPTTKRPPDESNDEIIGSSYRPTTYATKKPTKAKNPVSVKISTKEPPSTSYVTGPTTPRPKSTTPKKPSTSYVYSTTPTRKPTLTTKKGTKKPTTISPILIGSSYGSSVTTEKVPHEHIIQSKPLGQVPLKDNLGTDNPSPTVLITPKPTVNLITSSTWTQRPNLVTKNTLSTKQPSTSYVYSPVVTYRPTSGPSTTAGYTVSSYGSSTQDYVSSPSGTGVSGPDFSLLPDSVSVSNDFYDSGYYGQSSTHRPHHTYTSTSGYGVYENDYENTISGSSTSYPAFLGATQSYGPNGKLPIEYSTNHEEFYTSPNDLNNFPPVRNPNLNMSAALGTGVAMDEYDVSTPEFVEDQILDDKMGLLVSKIVESLQGNFDELADVVYQEKNSTVTKRPSGTTKKPVQKVTTTKRPGIRPGTTISRPGATTQKTPATRVTTKRPSVAQTNTRRTTKKPTTITTRRPTVTKVTTTRRPTTKPTKKQIQTTTVQQDEIDEEDEENEGADDETADQEEETSTLAEGRIQCGVRPQVKSGRIVGGKGATFGEFPWQVLVRESTWLGLFTKNKCGGVLITKNYVMTAAHCQPGFLASLVAVFGEFDISGDLETKRSVTKNVKRVVVHREYDAATFENDLALLELESPIHYDTHIVPICMPANLADFTGRMATVTGWGRLKYGGGVPSVLQEVQVPIIENSVCQEMFHTAGHNKKILPSFLCAGYANGQKDSCEGDSGGPLVLQRSDGRWELAGTVSHGIKCAAPYLPGVYMRTTYYKPWLESVTGVH
ncbi:serine protease filzig isoform X2 [Bradysia coprophila]|uniref:serine protease filzig isoform X2 n=1 Tax=Bradysia coprophila TaxID=38358 RepID=UPI00187DD439|nr:serine protease filzig isoform X2 [Bradysia coprophila]